MSSKDFGGLYRKSACLHALTKDRSLQRRPLPVPSRTSRPHLAKSVVPRGTLSLCSVSAAVVLGRADLRAGAQSEKPNSISDPGRRDPSSVDRHRSEAEQRSGERAITDDASALDVRR